MACARKAVMFQQISKACSENFNSLTLCVVRTEKWHDAIYGSAVTISEAILLLWFVLGVLASRPPS